MTKETDRMLLLRARAQDNNSLEELFSRYRPMVNAIARGYFLTDGDHDDLMQEGMIGLHKAILSYDINANTTFSTFAHLCITRQVQNAVRRSTKCNNSFLHNFFSIDPTGRVRLSKDDEDGMIYLTSDAPSPEEIVILSEATSTLDNSIREKLSTLEYNVFNLYLQGFSYKDIASKLDKDTKAVGNAIERIRTKLQFLRNS